jgi:hypothetical protein
MNTKSEDKLIEAEGFSPSGPEMYLAEIAYDMAIDEALAVVRGLMKSNQNSISILLTIEEELLSLQ